MQATTTLSATPRPEAFRRVAPFLFVIALALVVYAAIGPQQFANALTIGAIYALVALGYTMVYGIIELINFAHGEIFMVGAFVSMFFLTTGLGLTGSVSDPTRLALVLVAAFIVAMLVMGVIGVVIERFAYRPLRNAPRLAPLITAIGVSFILQNIVQQLFGPSPVNTPQLITLEARFELLGASIGYINVFIIAVAVGLMVALQLFVNRTKLGRAMRSTAQDREAAQLMGVDVNRTIAATFFIAAALAGAAGVVQGLYFGNIKFDLGFQAGLKAFTAAVLGGIGSLPGAVLGGLIIGLVETFWSAYFSADYKDVAAFSILAITLIFMPSGLLGRPDVEKV